MAELPMSSTFASLPSRARVYVAVVVCAGSATIAYSLYTVVSTPIGWNWTILALLTLVSGSATVKLPSMPATISISETFVFTSVLLFGSAAGTLTVALDALVISLWAFRRKSQPAYKSLFNVCALALTLWTASEVFFLLSGTHALASSAQPFQLRTIFLPLIAFTITYFLLNSWIITVAISLERHLPAFRIWRDNFLWLSLNYFGGASVAALLVSYTRDLDFTYLAVIVPLLVILYFTFSMSMGRVEDANRHLEQMNNLYMSTIETLAMAIDAKDQITHGHIRRVQTYAIGLAKHVGVTDPQLLRAIEAAALLHDMGKLAVPEYILNKPGPLTPAEFEKMKLHASVGADILSAIDFPYPVVPIVRHHHESWDGTGYPDRIAGTDIPIGARILSVVDCFDALTSDRPYRPRLSDADALQILGERRGTMYDPVVVDMFTKVHAEIAPEPTHVAAAPSIRAIADATLSPTTDVSRFEAISGSTEEMLTLFSLARGLSSLNSIQDAGDVISKHLRRLIPASLCVFFLYEPDTDELCAAHASGDNAGVIVGLRIAMGQRLSGWVAANRRTIRNSDAVLDLGESARAMNPRPRTSLSTPLLVGGKLIGVLTLYSTAQDAFSEEHQRVLEIIARQVASVLQQTADSQRARVATLHDKDTGLPNLEQFRDITSSQIAEATTDRPVSVLIIRVPFMKPDQDAPEWAGQDLLRVVQGIRRSLRQGDMLFRSDREGFIALLLHTRHTIAKTIATRVEATIAAEQQHAHGGQRVSVSTSVASAPQHGCSVEELLESARLPRVGETPGPSDLIH